MTVTEHGSEEEQQGAELAPKRRVMGKEEFRRLLAEDQAQEQRLLSSALERTHAELEGRLKPPAWQQVEAAELERLLAEPEVSERDLRRRATALEQMRQEIEGSLKPPAWQQAELERLINAPFGPHLSPEEWQRLGMTGTAFGLSPEEQQRLSETALERIRAEAETAGTAFGLGLHLSSAEWQRLILYGTTASQALTSIALVQEHLIEAAKPLMQIGEHVTGMVNKLAVETAEANRLGIRAMLDTMVPPIDTTRLMLDTFAPVGSTLNALERREVGRMLGSAYGSGWASVKSTWIDGHTTTTDLPNRQQPGGATVAPPQAEDHSLPAIDVVQLAGQWTEVLTLALTTGEATVKEVIEWTLAAAENRPGQRPPPWQEIEALAKAYKQRGHYYADLGAFARAMGYGRATAHRHLKLYQLATGEQVLVGRGKRKRGSM